jgi:hypothetical protein
MQNNEGRMEHSEGQVLEWLMHLPGVPQAYEGLW